MRTSFSSWNTYYPQPAALRRPNANRKPRSYVLGWDYPYRPYMARSESQWWATRWMPPVHYRLMRANDKSENI